jgi:hypothetical protein
MSPKGRNGNFIKFNKAMNQIFLFMSCFFSAAAGMVLGSYCTHKLLKVIVRRKVAQILKQKNKDK